MIGFECMLDIEFVGLFSWLYLVGFWVVVVLFVVGVFFFDFVVLGVVWVGLVLVFVVLWVLVMGW